MEFLKSRKSFICRIHQNEEFEKHLYCYEKFDKEGRLIELINYNEEETIDLLEKREYTDENLTRVHSKNMVFDNEQISEYVFLYGLQVEEVEYYGSESFIRSKIFYDNDGRIIRIEKSDESNAFYGETNVEYILNQEFEKEVDESGKLVNQHKRSFDSDDNLVEWESTIFYYDENRPVVESKTKNSYTYQGENIILEESESEGKVFYRKEMRYDSNNNLIEYTVMDHQVDYLVKGKINYNSQNLITSQVELYDERHVYTKEMKYDSFSAVSEVVEKSLDQDDYITVHKLEFTNEYW